MTFFWKVSTSLSRVNLVSSPCVRYTLLLACAEIELALNWLGSIDPGVDTRRLARSARGFPPVQAAHRSVPTSLIPPNLGALGLNGSLTVVAVDSAGLVGVDMFTRYLVRLVAVQLLVGLGLLPGERQRVELVRLWVDRREVGRPKC